jgi:hypothetical protein
MDSTLFRVSKLYCAYQTFGVQEASIRFHSSDIAAGLECDNSLILSWASEQHLVIQCSRPSHLEERTENLAGHGDNFDLEEALVWFCQALRLSRHEHEHTLSISTTRGRMSTGTKRSVVAYKLLPLVPLRQDTLKTKGCWTELFEVGVVAQRQATHTWGHGLRLSFSMMTSLADVHNYMRIEKKPQPERETVDEDGCYIMVGFFTALVPIARSPDKKEIQWHLICTGETLFNPEHVACLESSWLKTNINAIDSLRTATCYLGWCDLAHILLGTDRLEYKHCGTDLAKRSQTMHKKGYTAVAQLGINAGPIQVVGQGGPVWEFINNRQRFEAPNTYKKAINIAQQQVALVYDDASKRAWLVPKLSLMLHLCHIRFVTIAGIGCHDPIPFAQPSLDGSHAASQALMGNGDIEIFRYGGDIDVLTLRNMLVDVSTNLSNAQITRESPIGSMLFGTELMDMVIEPGTGSELREVTTSQHQGCAKRWLHLSKLVDCVGVCADIGLAIVPVSTSTTCDCNTVQPGRFYLAAHLQCLELLLQRQRHRIQELQNGSIKLDEKQEWCFNAYNPCAHNAQTSFWEDPQTFLQSILPYSFRLFPEKLSTSPAQVPTVSGAVIFGRPPPRKLKKNPQ